MSVQFVRTFAPEGAWEDWTETSQPRPPKPSDSPFEPCDQHQGCAQWGGVHFRAIRWPGLTWDVPTVSKTGGD
jgi:hypothetical protein